MPHVLWESFRAVFYAPCYAALELGAFEKHGLEVTFGTVPSDVDTGQALRDGQVHVVWGGPMRVMVDRDRLPESDLTCFCEFVARDPFFLIGRTPRPHFALRDLTDVHLATVSEAPTPWMCLRDDLVRAGIDPDCLSRVADQSMADNVQALLRGEADVIQVCEPYVETLTRSGTAHIWYNAAVRGLTTYTSLFATRAFMSIHPEQCQAFVRGVYAAQLWMQKHKAQDLAELISPYFPELERLVLMGAVARYFEAGIWGTRPVMEKEGFDRLGMSLASGGLIRRKPPFEECVEMSFARAAIADI